jgi:putative YphP/YqiW family bacilliredoxin
LNSLYDRDAVQPLWQELEVVGVEPLVTMDAVDFVMQQDHGTTLIVVNSVCGCAAGSARPGVALALQNKVIPDRLHTVFAGVDMEATERVREYLKDVPPSSPCAALLKDGELIFMLHRSDIEGRSPEEVAAPLKAAFDKHCTRQGPSVPADAYWRTFGPDNQIGCGTSFLTG